MSTYERITVQDRDDGVTLAAGHTVHAATDLAGKPRRLPDRVRVFFA